MSKNKPLFVIEASNKFAAKVLSIYAEVLHDNSAPPALIKQVNETIANVIDWQKENGSSFPELQDEKTFQDLLQEVEKLKLEVHASWRYFTNKSTECQKLETENAALRGEKIFLQNTVKGFTDLMKEILSTEAKEKLTTVLPELNFVSTPDEEKSGDNSHPHVQ